MPDLQQLYTHYEATLAAIGVIVVALHALLVAIIAARPAVQWFASLTATTEDDQVVGKFFTAMLWLDGKLSSAQSLVSHATVGKKAAPAPNALSVPPPVAG